MKKVARFLHSNYKKYEKNIKNYKKFIKNYVKIIKNMKKMLKINPQKTAKNDPFLTPF